MRLNPVTCTAAIVSITLVLAGCATSPAPEVKRPSVADRTVQPSAASASRAVQQEPAAEPRSPLLPSAFFADGAEDFIAWRCTPAQDLISAFPDDQLRLWSAQGHYLLDRAVVASGARYVKDDLTFWNKGKEAVVTSDNGRLTCREDVHRRTLTRADHPESIFHALGNEPGWTLDLDRDAPSMTLVTDNGERSRTLDYRLVALDNGEQASVTLRADGAAEPVAVQMQARACFDAMSGKPYPVRVRLQVGERVFRGCGQGIERAPR
ncbi:MULTISPECIES: MliC family protein [unclassified Modicisalibacter]|uniref:MliC family protein n=1 Tax=unclassified Modicisalibacter TaxID=2679913 RepID=UPI001CCC152E|nr:MULTISPECIES: MliC family protein [unclassified Modicisalibacter]MBZ9557919.1 MliC family protein [Modicisalibacter sp. R2A 31.J]MBZ9573413.1 MliC family protein [Modicisalibacter sp. MOD 31.J]